jgi:alpha-L-rhamnosidase
LIGGDEVGSPLDPAWTLYSARVFYQTFDVLDRVVRAAGVDGAFVIGAELGNGWYSTQNLKMWGQYEWRDKLPTGRPQLLAQLALVYSDGSWQRVVTEPEVWTVTSDGPTRRNGVYLGEAFDARKRIPGWATTPHIQGIPLWVEAVLGTAARGYLRSQPIPSAQVVKEIVATRLSALVWDMGQNLAGVARLRVRGPRGTEVRLRYGEELAADGSVNFLTSVAGQIKQQGKGGPCSPAVALQEDRCVLVGAGREPVQCWKHATQSVRHSTASYTLQGIRMECSIAQRIIKLKHCNRLW